MRTTLCTSLLILLLVTCFPLSNSGIGFLNKPASQATVKFIENKSQWDKKILFKANIPMGSIFLEKFSFTYLLVDQQGLHICHHSDSIGSENHHKADEERQINCHAFNMQFEGANANVQVSGINKKAEYFNYFLGNDQSKWASNVPAFKNIKYSSLYQGIDLFIGSSDINLKYEFHLEPNADPSQIILKYSGQDDILIINNELIIRNTVNNIIEQAPYAYQIINGDTINVLCLYKLAGKRVGFVFPDGYRKNIPLVIDPVVVASTYAGANGETTWGHTATYDNLGNIYTGARSFGYGYPATLGAFQMNFGGGTNDAAISKFSPDGSSLIWASYLGGNGYDFSHSLITNDNDELFVYGSTSSTNYPVTSGCFQSSLGGGTYDIFVTHFNQAGSALLGSTYIGGSGSDGQNAMLLNYGDEFRGEIILDNSGNPCVASFSSSNNFPTTAGAYDQSYNGAQDAVIFKLNSNLTQMVWSTYLGGTGNDAGFGLKLNSVDMVYVTGGTQSSNFPASQYVLNPTYLGGSYDGYICIFMPDISMMISGTFFGTSGNDECFFIQMDADNNVYVYGQTTGNMPITAGCYGNSGSPQFIAKLDQTLNAVLWQTVFGNGSSIGQISPTAFLVDVCNNIYAAGWGHTSGFQVSSNAVQPTTDGKDFYIIAFEQDATSLLYATFYGANDGSAYGDHVDGGTSRFDKKGVIYESVCACASAQPFPTTANAYHPNPPPYPPQYCDLAVFKIDLQLSGPTAHIGVNTANQGCAPFSPVFTNNSINAQEYLWDFGDNTATSSAQIPAHSFTTPGTFLVSCIAIDSNSCFVSDTAYQTITVLATPMVSLGNDTIMCAVPSLILNAGNPGLVYTWSTTQNSQQITVTTNGDYWVKADNGTCSGKDTIHVEFMIPPQLGPDTNLCLGLNVQLSTNLTGCNYFWNTGETTQSILVDTSGTFILSISKGSCTLKDSIKVTFLAHPIVNLGPDIEICQNQTVQLDAGNPGSQYSWNTGAATRKIIVSASGTYSVTVSNGGGCTGIGSINVTVHPLPVVDLLGDRILCENDTLYLDAGNPGSTYTWSTGAVSQQIFITDSGYYSVTVSISGCSARDTIHANRILLSVYLGRDTLLCPGGSITLYAGNPGNHYLWNTGDTNQAISVKTNGYFWVRVYQYLCHADDTIHVDLMQALNLPDFLNLCEHEFVSIASNIEADEFMWSTGETTPGIKVTEAGIYTLSATKGHCNLSDSTLVAGKSGIATLYIPNTFTPNLDNNNEIFSANGTDITFFQLEVFSRWGELVCETNNISEGWDGTFKGQHAPTGVYFYVIRYSTICSVEKVFKRTGTVMLLR